MVAKTECNNRAAFSPFNSHGRNQIYGNQINQISPIVGIGCISLPPQACPETPRLPRLPNAYWNRRQ